MVYEKFATTVANTAMALSILWLIIGTAFIALYRICYRKFASRNAVAPATRPTRGGPNTNQKAHVSGRPNTYQNAYVPGQVGPNKQPAEVSASPVNPAEKQPEAAKPQKSKTTKPSQPKSKVSNKPH